MEDILLAVMMVGVFVFEYFVVDRFGKFMDENYQWYQEPQIPCRKIYISETKGKNKDIISKEVNTVLNSLSNADDFEIIICKTVDPCMIEYLEESGCEVKYDYHAS